MGDAAYFRAQAQLCLELARQPSDRYDAERLTKKAAAHTERAEAIEKSVEWQTDRAREGGK